MSTIPFEQLLEQVAQLTPAEKVRLEQVLRSSSEAADAKAGSLSQGWARGLEMSEDFDRPLEDFKDYMGP